MQFNQKVKDFSVNPIKRVSGTLTYFSDTKTNPLWYILLSV